MPTKSTYKALVHMAPQRRAGRRRSRRCANATIANDRIELGWKPNEDEVFDIQPRRVKQISYMDLSA